jgi:hypothetical protein
LGAGICLRAHTPAVVTVFLTGAGTGPMDYRWEEYFSRAWLQELSEAGHLTKRLRDGPRRRIVIDAQMFREFGKVDQPVLVIGVLTHPTAPHEA